MVTSTADIKPPDEAYCETVRSTYGLTMPVLFDPDAVVDDVLDMPDNSGELVLTKGNVIRFIGGPAHAAVADELADIFGH